MASWPRISHAGPPDLAAHPGDRLDELALAVALDAGDAEDLAAADLDREPVDGLHAAVVERPQVADARARTSTGLGGAFSTRNTTSRPTIRLASDCWVAVVGVGGAGDPPVAQHGDPVGDGEHLAQLVGDEDDRLALVDEAAHDGEEVVDLARA